MIILFVCLKMKFALFISFLFSIAGIANSKATYIIGETSRPAPWYDCSGKQPGNYLHPYDCTRFIACDAGLKAFEFDCGECSNRPEACTPQNRLVYNATVDQCLWADESQCELGPGGTTTTEAITDSTTTKAPTIPKVGEPCDPETSRNVGYCQTYLRCDTETGIWTEDGYVEGFMWNPSETDLYGGKCDVLEKLSPELVHQYRSDPECLACFWKAKGECEQEYLFQAPNQRYRNVLTLKCSNGLVFSLEKRTCQRCTDVTKADGSMCC